MWQVSFCDCFKAYFAQAQNIREKKGVQNIYRIKQDAEEEMAASWKFLKLLVSELQPSTAEGQFVSHARAHVRTCYNKREFQKKIKI